MMELHGQWGKKKRKIRRKPGGAQDPCFQSSEHEDWMLEAVKHDRDYAHADRHIRVLQLRNSRKRYLAGEMKRKPPSLPLHAATEEQENEYIEKGLKGLPPNHILKTIQKRFCPSQHQIRRLREIFPDRGN